ncbi:hypothetical protein [Lysinibacillus agricola]
MVKIVRNQDALDKLQKIMDKNIHKIKLEELQKVIDKYQRKDK